jgi:hypothetical protein
MTIRYLTSGESHGPVLTAILEGLPSGVPITEEEINQINKEILEVNLPEKLLRRIEFFSSHFELYESANKGRKITN